ncbi:RES family NAD+ phosphorylase [Ascidiimonas sp. W6]|uniref:RES family NAD+ phosphorylase n=1 Tax=Ascidiimonas meishanensis TaxID=3128903 RepID=UPI0030EE67C8
MDVFRISQTRYADKLSASGAPNRWNKDNEYVIYTSQSRALCTLEMVAHRNARMKKLDYQLLRISVPSDKKYYLEVEASLPKDWRLLKHYSQLQTIGSDWYREKKYLILKVPSVLIPGEYNYVINTNHPNFSKVRIASNSPFIWDQRLL